MALHDFRCVGCGAVYKDIDIPVEIGARSTLLFCPKDDLRLEWIPQIGSMDYGAVKGAAFQAFEVYDGQNKLRRINSLHDLRRLERESEQQFRNGEGQPLVFRHWAQDQSNRDVHSLHPNFKAEAPTEEGKKKFGQPVRSSVEPEVAFGPGVSEANASALGEG